ncbi:MAG TPA: flagellar filament capping protein FliD [Burkholderiales bacterium]|nr:flagellar filament capping protein FliD [Burkholderiales bacterium]
MSLTAVATTNAAISSVGIGSGLDVTSIVAKLMSAEQQPLNLLTQEEASYNAKISAFGTLQSAVSQFQTAMTGLSDPSQFQSLTATSSNTAAVTAKLGTGAVAGSYSLGVTNLAQAQNLVTAGQASATTAIGSGTTTTLSFDFGTISGGTLSGGIYTGASFTSSGNGIKTVTINSTNDSLTGIANAINTANIGVSATVINTGNATNPYVLSLTSTQTGAASSMDISVSGDATLSSMLSYNPANNTGQDLTQNVAAQNSNFTLNGIAISNASNTISNAIQGVTLNLLGTTPSGTPATVSVAASTTATNAAVNQFVTAYNTLEQTLQSATAYNATTKQGAIFNGDPTVTDMERQLQSLLMNPVAGGGSNTMTMLYQAGVTLQSNGTLSVDNTKLNAAITANPNAFAGLFAVSGQTSDSLVSYTSAGAKTKPGNYNLTVSQLATQGSAVGTAALASSTTITAGSNDTLQIMLDGNSSAITLPPGTYTPAALATQIQSQINGNSTFSAAGSSVKVTIAASGALQLTSNRYGSASNANITGGDGQATVSFTGVGTTSGLDVAGTINGVAAIGSGQTLTGATGDASAGLAVQINGGALGARGTVSYSQGYAYQFNTLATSILSPTGSIATATNSYNTLLQQNAASQTAMNKQLAAMQARYMTQFTALDSLINSMNSTSTFLTQQLSSTAAST